MSTTSRAYDIWLRKPEEAQQLLESKRADLEGDGLSLLSWLVLTNERDDRKTEQIANAAIAAGGDTRFATAALAEVYKWRGDYNRAADIVRAAREKYPTIPWYALTLADILKDGGRIDEAEALLESVVNDSQLRRHALKRLSKWAVDRGDKPRALKYQTDLIALAPDYLVYASDYTLLAHLRLEAGDPAGARDVLQRGASIYAGNMQIREMLHQHFGETAPAKPPTVAPVDERTVGARRIPIKTRMITLRSGILPVIQEATAGQLRPDDILALSESPASAGQGRMIPLEMITPEGMAKQLSKFVGKIGPLHSPAGMQGAIMEAGRAKVLLGAAAGAAGEARRQARLVLPRRRAGRRDDRRRGRRPAAARPPPPLRPRPSGQAVGGSRRGPRLPRLRRRRQQPDRRVGRRRVGGRRPQVGGEGPVGQPRSATRTSRPPSW